MRIYHLQHSDWFCVNYIYFQYEIIILNFTLNFEFDIFWVIPISSTISHLYSLWIYLNHFAFHVFFRIHISLELLLYVFLNDPIPCQSKCGHNSSVLPKKSRSLSEDNSNNERMPQEQHEYCHISVRCSCSELLCISASLPILIKPPLKG